MTVYVDDMRASFRRMTMCHMVADTLEELDSMALAIGMKTAWRQNSGTGKEHYDVALGKRKRAIALGAVSITRVQLSYMIMARRMGFGLCTPDTAEGVVRSETNRKRQEKLDGRR